MTLAAGTHLGPYEIVAALGAGGMGEVYRAHDPRLGRDVAIKVLQSTAAIDPEHLRRFEQEARAAAALSHPNILAVFDIGQHDSAPYIVSELLEGRTLRAELHDGALPLQRALDLAIQVAHGLAAAHGKGIVHRDLKPENVFVTSGDRAKILDFGLAKLTQPSQTGAATALTRKSLTEAGVVFGTYAYMAPEQVRGQTVDARTDIFAFGTVLYELVTGTPAFERETAAESMTAILREEPPGFRSGPSRIPLEARKIIERCLAKTPAARFQSATDLAFALENIRDAGAADAESTDVGGSRRTAIARIAGFIALGAVIGAIIAAMWPRQAAQTSRPPAIQLQITMPRGIALLPWQTPAVAPDGTRIALMAVDETTGQRQVYLRSLTSATPQPVPGTARALHPFWSPDGERIAFFAEGG